MEVHGYSTYEDTLIALQLVKDGLLRVGGKTKFLITMELLADVKASYIRYAADRVAKKAAQEAELRRKKESDAADAARESMHKEVEKVENNISGAKSGISVANDLILQTQSDLEKALENKSKCIQRQLIETTTAELKFGDERKIFANLNKRKPN